MSNMRIGGLASGMDIDQIVSDLMKAERIKVDKLTQTKQITEWQQEDYRSINSTLRSFRDNQVFNMKLQSTFTTKQATSSNKDAVGVTANGDAPEGIHTIMVSKLAQGASVITEKINLVKDKTVLKDQFSAGLTGTQELNINGTVFKFDADKESFYDVVRRVNNQRVQGVTTRITTQAVDPNPEKSIEGVAQVQKLDFSDAALEAGLTIKIGDKSVGLYKTGDPAPTGVDVSYTVESFTEADKVAELVKRIATDPNLKPTNANLSYSGRELVVTSTEKGIQKAVTASVTGGKEWTVRASYDQTLDRLFLSTTKTGVDQQIVIQNTTLSDTLKLTNGSMVDTKDSVTIPSGMTSKAGRNADVVIDGLSLTDVYSSNNITLNGITYNLYNETETNVQVTVSRDTESVFKKITSFVDEYNKVMETIEKKLSEQRYKDYTWPLSDAEREGLTDDQIDQWKEKARSGMLRNDETLRSIRDKMRMAVTALSELGITTTADYTTSKLVITEQGEKKLREAIASDLQGVMDVFQGDQGVANKLSDQIGSTIKTIIDKAGSSGARIDDDSFLGKRIDGLQDDIDSWEDRLIQIEDRYWKQFTAMEKALNQMNQQSAWLIQQFSGGA